MLDSILYSVTWAIPFLIVLALVLDYVLCEPSRFHPLVGFGHWAHFLEKKLNNAVVCKNNRIAFVVGAIAWFAAVILPLVFTLVIGSIFLSMHWLVYGFFSAVILYVTIGFKSLYLHIDAVTDALEKNDIEQARDALGFIVSRKTDELSEDEIISATLETLLENSHDALFASLFWFVVAGPLGAVLHRLTNTLDAMWGYRSSRFLYFGKTAARLDDVLGFISAQLTALTFCLVSVNKTSFFCWFTQGLYWKSINAGSVMAAGAGALNITFTSHVNYGEGKIKRTALGCGNAATLPDIKAAKKLINRGLLLWVIVIFLVTLLYF